MIAILVANRMRLTIASLIIAFAGCASSTNVPLDPDVINSLQESPSELNIFATCNTYFSLGTDEEERFAMAGRVVVSEDGWLSLQTCGKELPFLPRITIPNNSYKMWIDHVGQVLVLQPGSNEPVTVGQLQCNRFNSGRRINPRIAGLYDSKVAPERDFFGDKWNAFVLSGWTASSK